MSASTEEAPLDPTPKFDLTEPSTEAQEEGEDVVGRLTFVSCATGSAPPPTSSLEESEEQPIHTPRSVSAIELHCESYFQPSFVGCCSSLCGFVILNRDFTNCSTSKSKQ
jgi:hypothetical protein